MNSSYITSAAQAEQLPELEGLPEVAFIGRSNCGKSTLLNALVGHNGLARASKLAGRTQMVNFFKLDAGAEKRLVLADLPGYGFAATSHEIRDHWQGLMAAYVIRPQVREFLFLADTRRAGDLDDEDRDLMMYLARLRPLCVVLTKVDKATQRDIGMAQKSITEFLNKAKIRASKIQAVSSQTGKGIDALRAQIYQHWG